MRAASVRQRNRVDDREAEPGSRPRPALVRSAEALERTREKIIGEASPAVADVELDRTVDGTATQDDGALSMAERVVDEVSESLFETEPVRGHP